MGKTLAKTYKHELKKEHKVSPRKQSRKQRQKQPKKRISFAGGRDFGSLAALTKLRPAMLVLAVLALAVLIFVPLSGWMRPVAYAIPLLLASVQILPETAAKLRGGDFLNNELFTALTAVLLFALGFIRRRCSCSCSSLVRWAELCSLRRGSVSWMRSWIFSRIMPI